jgi:hypothetical protein
MLLYVICYAVCARMCAPASDEWPAQGAGRAVRNRGGWLELWLLAGWLPRRCGRGCTVTPAPRAQVCSRRWLQPPSSAYSLQWGA